MGQILAAIVAAIPALMKILELLDKWFAATPEERAEKTFLEKVEARRAAASRRNEAIKEARRSYTSELEKIFNNRR